jgi:hypothetical protein
MYIESKESSMDNSKEEKNSFVMYSVLERKDDSTMELNLYLSSKEKLSPEFTYCCGRMFTSKFCIENSIESNPLYFASKEQLCGDKEDYIYHRLRLMQHVIEQIVEDEVNIDQWKEALKTFYSKIEPASSDLLSTTTDLPMWVIRTCHWLVNGASGEEFLAFYPKAKEILGIEE